MNDETQRTSEEYKAEEWSSQFNPIEANKEEQYSAHREA